MTFEVLLFDLDGTLYDHACGYEENVHANIFRFMVETKGGKFDSITNIDEAKAAWQPIFDKYNLTKRGLLGEEYEFDGAHYDRYIRRGPEHYIQNDPELREFLLALPRESRKVIFTNAPESSAHEILKLLGVDDLFEAVLGTEFMENKVCKPERAAFEKVLQFLEIADRPHRICYFEDSFKNLMMGKELGFATVFVNSATLANEERRPKELEQFDAIVERKVSIDLKGALPQLFLKSKQHTDVLLFDLDGTLYDRANGYMAQLRSNILQFMVDCHGGPFDLIHTVEEAQKAWEPIFKKYNNSKRGLLASGYEFDSEIYDQAIRRGAAQYFPHPDRELRELLESLPCQRKIIFTNAPESSAREILRLLGVSDLFDSVLGTGFFCNKTCKPEFEAFRKLFRHINVEPERICYFEDSFKNLKVGKELGMMTVFIASETLEYEGRKWADLEQFDAILEKKVGMPLKEKLPCLWEN